MLALVYLVFAVGVPVQAQVSIPFDQYLTGLGDALKANGMNILSNAIGSVNGSQTGAALLDALYRGTGFTLFGPVDAVRTSVDLLPTLVLISQAWEGIDLEGVSDDDLANVLAYHVSSPPEKAS